MKKYPMEEVDIKFVQSYQVSLGNVMGDKVSLDNLNEKGNTSPFPCTLVPSDFNKKTIEELKESILILNELRDKVARDYEFIYESLQPVAQVDELVSGLLNLYKRMKEEGIQQDIYLGIHRSDYMFHGKDRIPQQVEINMISAGAGSQSSNIGKVHEMILNRYTNQDVSKLYPSEALYGLAKALKTAFELKKGKFILFVVQEDYKERNWMDQRLLEFELFKQYKIPVIRLTLKQVNEQCSLENNELMYHHEVISVVYFRAGYTPLDYHSNTEWEARYLIEKSNSIKCPTIPYQLCGLKRIQVILNNKKVLERFLEKNKIEKLFKLFTELYPINKESIEKVLKNPEDFVMKSQREGGGNLIYGNKMIELLKNTKDLESGDSEKYLIMKRIKPIGHDSILLRDGKITKGKVINELGIFGYILSNKNEIIKNEYIGYLLRTKLENVEDGSVLSGIFHLDSIYFNE